MKSVTEKDVFDNNVVSLRLPADVFTHDRDKVNEVLVAILHCIVSEVYAEIFC